MKIVNSEYTLYVFTRTYSYISFPLYLFFHSLYSLCPSRSSSLYPHLSKSLLHKSFFFISFSTYSFLSFSLSPLFSLEFFIQYMFLNPLKSLHFSFVLLWFLFLLHPNSISLSLPLHRLISKVLYNVYTLLISRLPTLTLLIFFGQFKLQCCGAGGAEIIWDLELELELAPKLSL